MREYLHVAPVLLFLLSCKTNIPPNSGITTSQSSSVYQPSIDQGIRYEGFFNFIYHPDKGTVWLEINKLDEEFLYLSSLVTGVGSNDIGLDRGQLGSERIVRFSKNGSKILLIQSNYNFRADSENPYEKKAVKDAFAESVLWGFDIIDQKPDHFLVEATDFFLQDRHNVSNSIESRGEGIYELDLSKSAIDENALKNFPENMVIEAITTFKGKAKGEFIKQVSPDPGVVTVRQRHSFIKLPDDGYQMRPFDPRCGYMTISYFDYATPIDQPITKSFITRHRLVKSNPGKMISDPVEPIIYYLDRGVPEPVRSALLEGARWWSEAFTAAGFSNAFRVEMLPEDADPMDIRYNVIQWVHRSTRGWSYGSSVVDPRTGEIIKGHVSLGSLRVRQDFMIAQGLLAPYDSLDIQTEEAKAMALARIRQLSAHEVGHTLGLVHNYASSVNKRASVMDYPHPLIKLDEEGKIDLSDAYNVGIGEWDKMAINYGYSEINIEEQAKVLDEIINLGIDNKLLFISDRDARASGGLHPFAHLWDNGNNAVDELTRIREIRKVALKNIGINSISLGTPLATLEDILVPIYLLHRYQLEATAKLIGGMNYSYTVKGDNQLITDIVPSDMQMDAVNAMISTLESEFLRFPDDLLPLIPPKPEGYGRNRENFAGKSGLAFDPLSAAESSADYTLFFLLHPERVSRIVDFHSRQPDLPGLSEILETLIAGSIKKQYTDYYDAEINRTVSKLVVRRIIHLSNNDQASEQARAIALLKLYDLEKWFESEIPKTTHDDDQAHFMYCRDMIRQYFKSPEGFKTPVYYDLPMGSPIGSDNINCGF